MRGLFIIPKAVKKIIRAFNTSGFEIYIVGGCVRDSILGRAVNDWDLCTKATPLEIVKVCDFYGFKCIPTGIKHGTITVVEGNENYEITTYRVDGEYSDGRHPDNVEFTTSIMEDLARRDFTINALAYSEEDGLIDYYGGLEDINNGLIRCVGNPEKRFREDSLRKLRALRFAAQLGFDIEKETYKQLSKNNDSLLLLSIERIRDELIKILLSANASTGIKELAKLEMLQYVIPELANCIGVEDQNRQNTDFDVFDHMLEVVDRVSPKIELRLAALLHDIAKPNCLKVDEAIELHFSEHEYKSSKQAEDILKRLRFDNGVITKVSILIKYHGIRCEAASTYEVKKFINRVGVENLEYLFQLQIADIKSYSDKSKSYDEVVALKEKCNVILIEKQPLRIKDLAINGKDLIELGYKPDSKLGGELTYLLEVVLEKPELNSKHKLIEIIKRNNSH